MVYVWTVNEPEVHGTCDSAWISYVNRGSMADATHAKRDMTWLESAFLLKDGGVWRIHFFQSVAVPPAPKPE